MLFYKFRTGATEACVDTLFKSCLRCLSPMTFRSTVLLLSASLASAQGLDGLFLQMKFAFGNFQETHYFFTPDGQYLKDVPEGGLSVADLARTCTKTPTDCGTYKIAANNLVLSPRKGQPETLTLERSADGNLKLNGLFAKRVDKFPAGAKLDGTYSRIGNAGSVSAAQSYTFKPDGTFTSSALGAVSTSQGTGQSQSSSSGTYRLNGNTLELAANGQTTALVAYPYDVGKGDIRLNLNGLFFRKQ